MLNTEIKGRLSLLKLPQFWLTHTNYYFILYILFAIILLYFWFFIIININEHNI